MVLSAVAGGIRSRKLQTQGLTRDLLRHPGKGGAIQHASIAVAPDRMHADQPFDPPGDWYVVHTYSGFENKVKESLEEWANERPSCLTAGEPRTVCIPATPSQ